MLCDIILYMHLNGLTQRGNRRAYLTNELWMTSIGDVILTYISVKPVANV